MTIGLQRVGESHTYELISNLGYTTQQIVQAEHIYLLSEKGYAKHLAKIGYIRQRGDIGGSAKKVGKRIKELERLYGVREGSAGGTGENQYTKQLQPNNSVQAPTQSDLATQLGISVDTLQNYKMLADMIPELEEQMDNLSIRIKSSTTPKLGAV